MGRRKVNGPPLNRPRLGMTQEAVNKLLRPSKLRFGVARTPLPVKFMRDYARKTLYRFFGRKPVIFQRYVTCDNPYGPTIANYR